MKVRTNLSPGQLQHVAKKLETLAKSQTKKSLPLENPAEKELMRRADHSMDVMLENFQKEVSNILLNK